MASFLLFMLSSGILVHSELTYRPRIRELEERARIIREEEERTGIPSMEMKGIALPLYIAKANRVAGIRTAGLLSIVGAALLVLGSVRKKRKRRRTLGWQHDLPRLSYKYVLLRSDVLLGPPHS